ncbi:hypothetical protein CspeluHIS016_0308580 [Cutaneotrichosporon spelunceum]|uniref:R3H-associated N-terminal domain-containing protein n=1 Tax=Cutaneotrichosporon spelunceum TaxID=1672016 RepID=A0AAD3TUV3_9TREE|nr:hypothetical protein CspeluHIS016_0308580 [Cutaneotrichosporon spelunceum]
MTDVDTSPALMRLPAILQNPGNKALRQVEAFNAQQRERTAARRREASKASASDEITSKRGKRHVRRMNNAAHIDNPHAVQPKRGDMVPSVPLHYHPLRPSFPCDTLEWSTPMPSVLGRADPFGPSSTHGAFSTSLKGTRAMLRRRGRRAESIVPLIEEAVRGWIGGEFDTPPSHANWFPIDATLVDYSPITESQNGVSSRRLPAQHQVGDVPELPVSNGRLAAVLELSRSPAHLSWAVPDSFDRLVVHLVARYYELISWSEDERTTTGQIVRLTHIVRPNMARAKAPPPSHALLTPESSDLSGVSSSDTEHGSATEGDSSDAATEIAHSDTESVNGYDADTSLQAGYVSQDSDFESRSLSERWADDASDGSGAETPHDTGVSLTERFETLALHRTESHGSSAYASSEGGWTDGGVDSSIFHADGRTEGWAANSPIVGTTSLPLLKGGAPQRLGGNGPLDKPTFFEYLFGE